jgi:hypothetical protein
VADFDSSSGECEPRTSSRRGRIIGFESLTLEEFEQLMRKLEQVLAVVDRPWRPNLSRTCCARPSEIPCIWGEHAPWSAHSQRAQTGPRQCSATRRRPIAATWPKPSVPAVPTGAVPRKHGLLRAGSDLLGVTERPELTEAHGS